MFDSSDPKMQQAIENARANFKYFWRELAWERRRIVPGLDLAFVKVPFSDGDQRDPNDGNPAVEEMWVDDIDFDGKMISGVLINSPNWLTTVNEGDRVRVPISQISDWMFAIGGEVYGGFTVNLMRSRMDRGDRRGHDSAWGLDFGDPEQIRTVYSGETESNGPGGFFKKLFGGKKQTDVVGESDLRKAEHPMSVAMVSSLEEVVAENPTMLTELDDQGWTPLHQQALAGSTTNVIYLLDHGADPTAKTGHGLTPLDLAKSLDWKDVMSLLVAKGGG